MSHSQYTHGSPTPNVGGSPVPGNRGYRLVHELSTTSSGCASSLATSAAHQYLFAGCDNGDIHVWDTVTKESKGTIRWGREEGRAGAHRTAHQSRGAGGGGGGGSILSCQVSQGSLYAAGSDAAVQKWALRNDGSWCAVGHLQLRESGTIFTLCVTDNYLFAGLQNTKIVRIPLSVFTRRGQGSDQRDPSTPQRVMLSLQPDWARSGPQPTTFRHPETGVDISVFGMHTGYVYSLVRNGDSLFSGSGDHTIRRWDINSLHCLSVYQGHTGSIYTMAIHGDLLYSGSRDNSIRMWRTDSELCVRTIESHNAPVQAIAMVNNWMVTTDSSGKAVIWALDRMSKVTSFQSDDSAILAVCPSKRNIVLSRSGGSLEIYRVYEDKALSALSPHALHGSPMGRGGARLRYLSLESDEDSDVNDPDYLINLLEQFVAIPSVSGDPVFRDHCWSAASFLRHQLMSLGAECPKLVSTIENRNPVVQARLGTDPGKPTVCIYGHYDVVPAGDGWDSDPYILHGRDGYLYGRGSSDNKGPIMATVQSIRELLFEDEDLPANFVFFYEGEEECGSVGVQSALALNRTWLEQSDLILVSNNYWLNDDEPCLTYGLRGVIKFSIIVDGASTNLHSGVDGNSVREPMIDMVRLLSSLVDSSGKVQVPGFYDRVRAMDATEAQLYDNLHVSLDEYKQTHGLAHLQTADPSAFLRSRWRMPSLTVHGVESSAGSSTVIPHRVIARLSIRTVPDQQPEVLMGKLTEYCKSEFDALKSGNALSVECSSTGDWWVVDDPTHNPYYVAAEEAVQETWGKRPLYVREGGSMPVTAHLEKSLGVPAVVFPMSQASANAHLANERMRVTNLLHGKAVLKSFFKKLAKLKE